MIRKHFLSKLFCFFQEHNIPLDEHRGTTPEPPCSEYHRAIPPKSSIIKNIAVDGIPKAKPQRMTYQEQKK